MRIYIITDSWHYRLVQRFFKPQNMTGNGHTIVVRYFWMIIASMFLTIFK